MIVAAGGDHRHSAAVLDAIRVRVDTLVQLRRSTQREGQQKCHRNASRYECTPAIRRTHERAHCAESLCLRFVLRKRFLQDAQPQLQPALLRLSAMISQYFTQTIVSILVCRRQAKRFRFLNAE